MTNTSTINKIRPRENNHFDTSIAGEADAFAALVSHELRTPLTSIRGALSLLLSGKLGTISDRGKRLLELAVKNTDRLVRLTAAIESDREIQVNIISAAAMARYQLEKELQLALERQQFQLHYQPIISLETNKISGFEALVRWQHPRRGLVSPAEFIPLAEKTGLIEPLGTWVLDNACRQLYSWQQEFACNPSLTMSVNLSSLQLSQPNLVEQVQEILQKTNLATSSLRLEITESAIMENQTNAIATLHQLKALGIQLYMDDFGTGYSSLSRLHELPIDLMKIDRSFVSQKKWDIIRAIMILASSLGLEVIAEGIETAEEVAELKRLGCKQGQGYFYSKPVDAQAAADLIALQLQ